MFDILTRCLDVLFPKEGEAEVVESFERSHTWHLLHPTPIPHGTALTRFKNPVVRALIHEAKFHRNERASAILSELLRMHLEAVAQTFDFIVPIPLSAHRLRTRGYNQVEEVLKAHDLCIPVVTDVLFRTRNTAPQTELSRDERRTNVVGAFIVRGPTLVKGKRILLVDDVTTTGATLSAARGALMDAGAFSVRCVTLTH